MRAQGSNLPKKENKKVKISQDKSTNCILEYQQEQKKKHNTKRVLKCAVKIRTAIKR